MITDVTPEEMIPVTTEDEFRAACQRSRDAEVIIQVNGSIHLTQPIQLNSSRGLRIEGVGDGAELVSDMWWDGKQSRNALHMYGSSRWLQIEGLRITGHNAGGAFIRVQGIEWVECREVQFHDVANFSTPAARFPFHHDFVHGQTINGRVLDRASFEHCRFERCGTGHMLSHAIYLNQAGTDIRIHHCQFRDCPGAVQCGSARQNIEACLFDNSFPTMNNHGQGIFDDAITLRGNDDRVVNCTFQGLFTSIFFGTNVRGSMINGNRYRYIRTHRLVKDPWEVFAVIDGQYVKWDEWRSMGFDSESTPPKWTEEKEN